MSLDNADSEFYRSRRSRVAPEVGALLAFIDTGTGAPREIINQMRLVVEAYCTLRVPGFFDLQGRLWSLVEKIYKTGVQLPACQLLDELDDIHDYSHHYECGNPFPEPFEHLDLDELAGFVRRTLEIVDANR
jgi:hypothetical protein